MRLFDKAICAGALAALALLASGAGAAPKDFRFTIANATSANVSIDFLVQKASPDLGDGVLNKVSAKILDANDRQVGTIDNLGTKCGDDDCTSRQALKAGHTMLLNWHTTAEWRWVGQIQVVEDGKHVSNTWIEVYPNPFNSVMNLRQYFPEERKGPQRFSVYVNYQTQYPYLRYGEVIAEDQMFYINITPKQNKDLACARPDLAGAPITFLLANDANEPVQITAERGDCKPATTQIPAKGVIALNYHFNNPIKGSAAMQLQVRAFGSSNSYKLLAKEGSDMSSYASFSVTPEKTAGNITYQKRTLKVDHAGNDVWGTTTPSVVEVRFGRK